MSLYTQVRSRSRKNPLFRRHSTFHKATGGGGYQTPRYTAWVSRCRVRQLYLLFVKTERRDASKVKILRRCSGKVSKWINEERKLHTTTTKAQLAASESRPKDLEVIPGFFFFERPPGVHFQKIQFGMHPGGRSVLLDSGTCEDLFL